MLLHRRRQSVDSRAMRKYRWTLTTESDDYKKPRSSSVGTGGGVERMRGPCACPFRHAIRLGFVTRTDHPTPGQAQGPYPSTSSSPCAYRIGYARLAIVVVHAIQPDEPLPSPICLINITEH